MDKIAKEIRSFESERDSPPSPKWTRTESVTASYQDQYSGESKFEFPKRFQKNEGSASPSKPFQDKEDPTYTADRGFGYRHKGYQCDESKLKEKCVTKVATSDMDIKNNTGSTVVCCTIAKTLFPCLEEDEQHSVIGTDKADSHPRDDAGGVSAVSDTLDDTRADTSTRHDWEQLGKKSLDYWSPFTGGAFPQREEDRTRGQHSSSHIGAVASELSEVKCQTDCVEDSDTVFYESAEVKECNQTGDEHGCRANVSPNMDEEEAECCLSHSDYMGCKSSCSRSEVRPPGNLAGAAKNEVKNPARWETDVKENATVCDGGLKNCRDDEDSTPDPVVETADCAEVAIVPCDAILASNAMHIGAELSLTVEADDLCSVAWWCALRAADEMIVEVQSETAGHSAETLPASSSQEDNEVSLYCVIDPVIWSRIDAEAEKKHHDSASTTGVEPLASLTLFSKHTQFLEHSYVRPWEYTLGDPSDSVQTSHGNSCSGGAQQHKGKTEFTCQSSTEQQHCPFTRREKHSELGSKEDCRESEPSSSLHRPVEQFHACNEIKENCFAVGHLNEKQAPAGCFLISPEHCNTQEAEYLTTEVALKGEMAEGKAGKEVSSFEEDYKIHVDKQTNEEHNEHMTEKDCANNKISSNKSTVTVEGDQVKQSSILLSSADCKSRTETTMTENKDRPLSSSTSPPLSYFASVDAVVPSAHYLNPRPTSQNADETTPQHSSDRSASVPSAAVLFDRFAGGFDTFEKIQLSPDDDDDNEGLGHSPLLTSLPSQRFHTSQGQCHLSLQGDKCHNPRVISDNNECQDEHMEVDRCLNIGIGSCEGLNSAFCEPYQSDLTPESKQSIIFGKINQTDSEINRYLQFEMKEQFDVVIEEMKLYFLISTNDIAADGAPLFVSEPEKAKISSSGDHPSKRAMDCPPDTSSPGDESNDSDDCRPVEPRVSFAAKPDDREQEVPLDFSCQQENESMYPVVELRGPREADEVKKTWTPSFTFPPRLGQRHPDQHQRLQRLEPLKTCKLPIRVGLSKKAKTRHLHPHRPHPYKHEI